MKTTNLSIAGVVLAAALLSFPTPGTRAALDTQNQLLHYGSQALEKRFAGSRSPSTLGPKRAAGRPERALRVENATPLRCAQLYASSPEESLR
jgi:hypothetical protein